MLLQGLPESVGLCLDTDLIRCQNFGSRVKVLPKVVSIAIAPANLFKVRKRTSDTGVVIIIQPRILLLVTNNRS